MQREQEHDAAAHHAAHDHQRFDSHNAKYTGKAGSEQKKLKSRDPELSSNWGTICTLVEMTAADGKKRKIQSASIEGLLRLIQFIPGTISVTT